MTPGVITCTSCGTEAPPGNRFCSRCARPLFDWSSDPAFAGAPNAARIPGYTNTWDTVLPRLQEALFGEFVISRELGRGGMAAVFLAHQLRLNRKVAIKVMAPSLMSELGLVERFRDEATTVARLDHPNIISIFEVGETAGLQYFVMQYVAGRSLERVVRQHGQLPLAVTRAITFAIGSALGYAHRNQVIHRDVKPGNVLLSLDGRVMVSDFGIAKVAASTVHTQTGAVVGTPAYMSPEQCFGLPLTWSADQYSLGILAYEMLTGAQPFVGAAFAVMRGHAEEAPPPMLGLRPDCPLDVVTAIERMLAKKPADRFASMGEALNALGASRARIDDAVEAAIGELAIPLPDEEGVVLVHTPASPAPQQTPAQSPSAGPSPGESPDPGSLGGTSPRGPSLWQQRLRNAVSAASALLRRAAGWSRTAWSNASSATESLARRVWLLTANGMSRARNSRLAIGIASGTILVAVVAAFVIVLAGDSGRGKLARPPRVVPDSTLGATGASKDSLRDSVRAVSTDSLSDSLAARTFVPRDSAEAREVAFRESQATLTLGEPMTLKPIVKDFRGKIIPEPRLNWIVADESVATIDSATGRLRTKKIGKTIVIAKADYGADTMVIIVRARQVAPNPVASVEDAPTTKPAAEQPPPAFDEAAEANAIHSALSALLRDIATNVDTTRINALFPATDNADAAARARLIDDLRKRNRPYFALPQNALQPHFSGDTASVSGRIQLKWQGALRTTGSARMLLEADFVHRGQRWDPVRFRVRYLK